MKNNKFNLIDEDADSNEPDIKKYAFDNSKKISYKIAIIYFVIGLFWIVFSDKTVELIFSNHETYAFIQTIKGFFYIFITAVLLYFLVLKNFKKITKKNLELNENFKELNATKNRIYKLAYYDNLTSLKNDNYLKEVIEYKINNDKEQNEQFAILYIDVDNFKTINNILGYDRGDEILKLVSSKLLKHKDLLDTICRYSGDEFVLLVTDFKDKNYLKEISKNILKSIESLWLENSTDFYMSASLGIAIYPEHGSSYNALITNANTAMNVAKDKGANSFEIFSQYMYLNKLKYVTIENDLRKAITNNEFVLYYQPKINLKNKKIVGAEALIRWKHPKNGIISPYEFIHVAEKTGLIVEIGDWVTMEAFKQIKRWQEMGYKDIIISINLSPIEFNQKNIIEKFKNIIELTKVDPKFIEVEITESVVIENISQCIHLINSIKELGIKVSLDDFGTGYSSLSYLRQLPIDILKLDKSLICNLNVFKNDALVKSIIEVSHSMDLEIVAEGIETKEDAEHLNLLQCDIGQGYYFHKPMPVNEIENLFER